MAFFELAYWHRALKDPVILSGLIVDLLPVFAVLALGWGALELVLLYWLENLVIGIITLMRILLAGFGKMKPKAIFTSLFFGNFFLIHYGGFCLVHGVFLMSFLTPEKSDNNFAVIEIVNNKIFSGEFEGLSLILLAIFLWQFFIFVIQFVRRGEHLTADPHTEMFAPYGRIVLLQIGIFVGVFAMDKFGQPMAGILALILFRAAYGFCVNIYTRVKNRPLVEPL